MNREKQMRTLNGWAMLAVTIADFLVSAAFFRRFVYSAIDAAARNQLPNFYWLVFGVLVVGLGVFLCSGFFTLQPNEGRVLILFGAYRGTVRQPGWHWTNPLNTKKRISLARETSTATN